MNTLMSSRPTLSSLSVPILAMGALGRQSLLCAMSVAVALMSSAQAQSQTQNQTAASAPAESSFQATNASTPASANASNAFRVLMAKGINERIAGQVHSAFNTLLHAFQTAQSLREQAVSAGEIGVLLSQSKRFSEAEVWLTRAYNLAGTVSDTASRARIALELGNVFAASGQKSLALNYYQEAQTSPTNEVRYSAKINQWRMNVNEAKGMEALRREVPTVATALPTLSDDSVRATLQLSLANLLVDTNNNELSTMALPLATSALATAQEKNYRRINVGALEVLSKLYEQQQSDDSAAKLAAEAVARADATLDQDLLIELSWRLGRIYARRGDIDRAILAYDQAVSAISAIRIDIPVVYTDGKSSFRETLEPIYLGLADLLLRKARATEQSGASGQQYLRAARNAAEGVKQSELQDYLGDRCTVESAQQSTRERLPADTAVLYPIVFDDRVETLVETANGLKTYAVAVPRFQINNQAKRYSNLLRNGYTNINALSQELHKILFASLQADLTAQNINRVVVVPDGVLRLVPYAALNDGKNYMLEKFAFSVTSALSLTQQGAQRGNQKLSVLVAGLETPGPVVDILGALNQDQEFSAQGMGESAVSCGPKLNSQSQTELPTTISTDRLRSLPGVSAENRLQTLTCSLSSEPTVSETIAKRQVKQVQAEGQIGGQAGGFTPNLPMRSVSIDTLRENLRLPGVINEVNEVKSATNAKVIMNNDFSLERFRQEVQSGAFNVIHIASHGVFGGSGDNSYILANDKLMTMNVLQNILRGETQSGTSIELLSLSACETADGDDRAPLGISGAALKARARSALGTLWPVADEAAQKVMITFYQQLQAGRSKTDALREGQLVLLRDPKLREPFFWAPFLLVGAWQ